MDNFAPWPQADGLREDERNTLPEALQQVAHLYATQPMPRPTTQQTQRLLKRLLEEETTVVRTMLPWRTSSWQILRIARWQAVLMGPLFWITSVLLLAAGFLGAPLLGVENIVNLLIVLLPITAILSVIQAVHKLSLRVHEVEASCPTNIVETTTALALAIVGFDILLGVIATGALALAHWAPFSTLLLTWLGPLLLLVGLSFPVALRWGTWPAALVGGGPWLLLILAAYVSGSSTLDHVSLLSHDTTVLTLSSLSALIGLILLLTLFLRGSGWQKHLMQY